MFSPQEFFFILQWWLPIFALGLVFLPLTFLIFDKFYDHGYLFSKVLGIALVSYTLLILNIFKILPFNLISIFLIIWVFFLANLKLTNGKEIIEKIVSRWKIFLFEEILFLTGIVLWAYVRAHEPSINGLEKFMDFGFINSILRSTYQPAVDMWFPPHPINYYYFGHLTTAVLTKLSYLPSNITYNLMIATIFSFTFGLSFSLGLNFILRNKLNRINFMAGILTGALVSLGGNLHTIYALFKSYNVDAPVPFWNLVFSASTFPNGYWYPNATRFIPLTIHEFPLYSFVVSDLHGHVIDIPFVLLTIALCYVLIQNYNSKFKIFNSISRLLTFNFALLTLLALMLAIMYMTNAWDSIIYFILTVFVIGFVVLRATNTTNNSIKTKLLKYLILVVLVLIGSIFFSLPFSLHFKPFASGIGILCAPSFLTGIGQIGPFLFEADHCQHSAWWQLLILYGFFYFFVLSFILFILVRRKKIKLRAEDIFIIFLIFVSSLLIIIPEFVYLKDIYPAHYRANTMFKLVYQSFIMLSISSGYIIVRIASSIKPKIFNIFSIYCAYLIFAILFLILVLIYQYFAIKSYYGDLKTFSGLDGIAYMKDRLPDDYEAINFLNQNIKGSPVIVEAQGDSYTDYARISANTGLPTVLGWTVHEWLWRGSYDIPSPRIEEVRLIYESDDIEKTKSLLKKYNVEYVYLGNLEREKYSNINETKFEELGDVVFEAGQAKIYKLDARR